MPVRPDIWADGWSLTRPSRSSTCTRFRIRPITPKLRVITRHSKLLYFRKYLPRWQFKVLGSIVALEAAVRSIIARCSGHKVEANAWRIVGGITRRMREGEMSGERKCGTSPKP